MIDVVAHSGGFSWDEGLLFALPVVILVILQIVGRRKAAREADADAGAGEQDGGNDKGAG